MAADGCGVRTIRTKSVLCSVTSSHANKKLHYNFEHKKYAWINMVLEMCIFQWLYRRDYHSDILTIHFNHPPQDLCFNDISLYRVIISSHSHWLPLPVDSFLTLMQPTQLTTNTWCSSSGSGKWHLSDKIRVLYYLKWFPAKRIESTWVYYLPRHRAPLCTNSFVLIQSPPWQNFSNCLAQHNFMV